MAYNNNKGPQHTGDIQYEGDPNDVQIDFENDQIILRTGGAPRVNVTNTELSASGIFRTVGSLSGSGDIAISGTMHVGDSLYAGNNTSSKVLFELGEHTDAVKIVGADAEYFRIDTDDNKFYFRQNSKTRFGSHTVAPTHTISVTGDVSGSGTLQAVGTTRLGSLLIVSGAALLGAGAIITGNTSGSGTHQSVGAATFGSTLNVSGATTLSAGANVIGALSASSALHAFSLNTAADRVVAGYNIGTGGQFAPPGNAYIYNTGYYSGSAPLHNDGATTLGSTLNVSGTITGTSITGSMGLYNLTNGTLQVGHEEVGATVAVKISTTTDNSVPMLVKTPNNETLFALTGSGKAAFGGTHLAARLNVSGSDIDQLISLKSDTVNPAFYVSGSGNMFVSGNIGVGTTSPEAALDINGNAIRIRTADTPSSASDFGLPGEIRWDANYIYICIGVDTWRRIAHSTW